jgi:hypothetical protein
MAARYLAIAIVFREYSPWTLYPGKFDSHLLYYNQILWLFTLFDKNTIMLSYCHWQPIWRSGPITRLLRKRSRVRSRTLQTKHVCLYCMYNISCQLWDKSGTNSSCALEGSLSRWSRLCLQSLAPTNPHLARVVGYGPFFLCIIHKEGQCPSSGDINGLMMKFLHIDYSPTSQL